MFTYDANGAKQIIQTTLTRAELAAMYGDVADAYRDAAQRGDHALCCYLDRVRTDCAKMAMLRPAEYAA